MTPLEMKIASELGLDYYSDNSAKQYEIDATWRLWHLRKPVIVPYYAVMTPEQQKLYGTAYSGGLTKYGRELFNKQPTYTVMAPINHIKLYAEGIPISYPDRESTVEIYEDIYRHMELWSRVTSTSLNRRHNHPPLEEFEIMMEYADRLKVFVEQFDVMNSKPVELDPIQRVIGLNGFIPTNSAAVDALRYLEGIGIKRTPRNDNMRHITGYRDNETYGGVSRFNNPITRNLSPMSRGEHGAYGNSIDDLSAGEIER